MRLRNLLPLVFLFPALTIAQESCRVWDGTDFLGVNTDGTITVAATQGTPGPAWPVSIPATPAVPVRFMDAWTDTSYQYSVVLDTDEEVMEIIAGEHVPAVDRLEIDVQSLSGTNGLLSFFGPDGEAYKVWSYDTSSWVTSTSTTGRFSASGAIAGFWAVYTKDVGVGQSDIIVYAVPGPPIEQRIVKSALPDGAATEATLASIDDNTIYVDTDNVKPNSLLKSSSTGYAVSNSALQVFDASADAAATAVIITNTHATATIYLYWTNAVTTAIFFRSLPPGASWEYPLGYESGSGSDIYAIASTATAGNTVYTSVMKEQ